MIAPEENRKRIARANAEEKASLEVFERRYQLWKRDLDWTHGRLLKPQDYQATVREFQQRLAEEIQAKNNSKLPEVQRQDLALDARQVSSPRPHRRSSSGKARKVRRGA